MSQTADPRTWPDPRDAPQRVVRLHELATAALAAATREQADAIDADIDAVLRRFIEQDDGAALASTLACAPSSAIYRHLWRRLVALERAPLPGDIGIDVTLFAIPVIIVAGAVQTGVEPITLPELLADVARLAEVLREHRALRGNLSFALHNALVSGEALDVDHLPQMQRSRGLAATAGALAAIDLPALAPTSIHVAAGHETVHLRFLLGAALAAPRADVLADEKVGAWGVPFARELSRQLAQAGATVLAMPRAPASLLAALGQGRMAQRDVSAQLFATNAIRRYRTTVGEPSAVISAHACAQAPAGGELRVSLSSPFDERDAEGLRCPLWPLDRVGEVTAMLLDLLRDCRVDDVRLVAGVYPDLEPLTRRPLLFKPNALPTPQSLQ